ncbi:MAG: hypothetical protein PHU71_00835 [Candidatus Gracilibacteria bacterium]|nr:hypothetical protein [Candidatus Gracilibacteria bacterium]
MLDKFDHNKFLKIITDKQEMLAERMPYNILKKAVRSKITLCLIGTGVLIAIPCGITAFSIGSLVVVASHVRKKLRINTYQENPSFSDNPLLEKPDLIYNPPAANLPNEN